MDKMNKMDYKRNYILFENKIKLIDYYVKIQ